MKIKIFLDTICGWCYIGHKKLFKALAEFKDRKFEVEYAPFLLNPDMPLAGIKRSDYLVMKFGSKENAQPMYDRMTEQAKSENLNFQLNDIQITPSTTLSHILIDLSKGMKEQNSIVENIFKTYFIDAGNIGDSENLITIGVKNGLKKEIIKEALFFHSGACTVSRDDNKPTPPAMLSLFMFPSFILISKTEERRPP